MAAKERVKEQITEQIALENLLESQGGVQVPRMPGISEMTRFLRSTRSAKLERRFPEEAVIWQEPHPLRKKPCGRFVDGRVESRLQSPARRKHARRFFGSGTETPVRLSITEQTGQVAPKQRLGDSSAKAPGELGLDRTAVLEDPHFYALLGRRYACHNDLISEPLLGEMLLDAAAKGDVLQVRGILDQAELDQQNVASVLASRDFDDRTPLHWAARQGHLEVCDLLLRKKADALSTSGPPLATPLMLASLHGHAGVVRRLLGTSSASKQLQSCDAKGRNALHLACCSKSQVLQLLLHVQPELLHSQDKLGRNPLYYALGNPVPEEQWEILNTLLLGKCCAHQVDYLDRSPLWYAVHAGAVNSTALMLRLSPDRPPEVATSSKTRHDLERPKPESQPKPEESKAEEKKDKPKPDAKPEESKAEEKKDEPKPDAKPEEPKAEEKKDEPKPDAKPEEPKAEEKKDEPKPDAKPEEPKAEEKKDEPKPDAKPEEPKAEEKKDEPKPDAKPEEQGRREKAEEKKDEPKPDAKPEEPKAEEKKDEPKPDAKPEEPKAEEKKDEPKPDAKPEEPKAEEKKDEPKPDAKPEEPKAEEKKDEPKPDAKPEEPKAEEKKDEPKPDAKPEEPKAEEKKDEPKPDAKPEEPKAEEKKDEPKPDAKPEEPKAEEKKDEPKPDAKPEEPKAEEKKDEPKPDAKPEEPKTVPALPNVPHVLALETPRSYVDPVPVLKTVTESGSAEATAVAKELQELLEQHKYLNPQTAHVRHPLHGWVSRCSQLLADSKVAEAKVCLARVTTGLNTDMTRISTAFRRFDMDESKHLDETEIMRLAAYLGVDVNPKDLDHNTDGEISLSEFQDFVGRMGGIQQLFEQRRRRVAETRRDTLSMAGVAIGARVLAHFYAGVKPDRYKSPEPEEAVVLGVHYKDDDMAGPSQLEVELEFLRDPTTLERTKKATCVPSHWIVSTSEDAEVAAALREVGIHDEDQPFWDAVFPASETREVVRLTTCQRRALALVRAQATYLHQAAYPRVLERFQKMGYTDKELQAVLSWVQDLAPVIIHVQLDTVGRFLESDEFYRSQFETKTSNGALDDGNNIRIGWEEDLFGDAYHDATPFERCKYGALNVTNDFEGCRSALQYGDSYLVLKDVRLRCSFAATDSGGIEGSRLAVLDKYAHVLEEYHEHEIQGILDVAMAPEPRAAEELPKLMRGSTENSIREWLTFGFPQLKRKEGCFFFEVELKEGCILPHVGLAGDQFMWTVGVKSVTGIGGIGDDEYSCGVDGLHGACLKNGPVSSWNVSWPKGSVERVHFDCDNYEREQSEILGKTVLVGVLVDLDHGTVTFASDGAWGSTWNPHITQEDMPCYHEGLFPAISIKGSASFHFGPDFKHPPPKSFCDFTPWAKLGEVRVDNPAVGCSDVLNIYKEAQIHGEVCLKKHVLRLVANKRYRQQTRSWSIQVTGAGRCNGTYQWFDRFNKRSCYKSPSGCIIYYNQQESCWRINSRQEFTGFVFQAKSKETSRYVSNMGGHSEPPRTGWKPTLGLKGCVPVEIFQKALVQQGVPTEDLEHMIKVLRGSDEEKDSIFRKLGETTFKAEWHRLVWPPHARPLSAAGAWAEVVRLAQSDILTKLGLSTSTAVVVSPQGEPDGTWECLVSLGPREESDSTGVAFHVINLR
ncbi:unnamed protein product, partial [Cladocopium goreaui]